MTNARNSLSGPAASPGGDPFASLDDALARFGKTYAGVLASFSGGTEAWLRRSMPAHGDFPGGRNPAETLELLRRTGWIGELNILLAVLTAQHRRILPRLGERKAEAGPAPAAWTASTALWNSAVRWGATLCRVLRLLNRQVQARAPDDRCVRRCGPATVLALHQLYELLIHARRWLAQCRAVHPGLPDLPRPALLERELERLERAWLEARCCGPAERRAILREIGLLQHWTAEFREPYVSRHAFTRRQKAWPRPWLNRMIRMNIGG